MIEEKTAVLDGAENILKFMLDRLEHKKNLMAAMIILVHRGLSQSNQ